MKKSPFRIIIILTFFACKGEPNSFRLMGETPHNPDFKILGDKYIDCDENDPWYCNEKVNIYERSEGLILQGSFQVDSIPKTEYFVRGKSGKNLIAFRLEKESDSGIFHPNSEVLCVKKIRPNNFELDSIVSPENIEFIYREYFVKPVFDQTTYLIHNKKYYYGARTFTKLIQFDSKGKIGSVLYFPDYNLLYVQDNQKDRHLILEKPVYGTCFEDVYQYKIVRINEKNEVLMTAAIDISDPISTKVISDEDGIHIKTEISYACHICYWDSMLFIIHLEYKSDEVYIEVTQYPENGMAGLQDLKNLVKFNLNGEELDIKIIENLTD